MRIAAISVAAAWLIVGATTRAQEATTLTFDQEKPGTPPARFMFAAMRQPGAGSWIVRRQGTRGHLAHDADPAATGYALAVFSGSSLRDLALSVRLRLSGGRRTGGLIWHYQDEQNYYASVLDLQRGELTMYRVASGNRVQLEFEDDLELDLEAWHTMKVVHTGNSTRVSLGGIRVFEDEHRGQDRARGGRVGLVAAGDAEVWYDDLRIDLPSRGR
jgi:hypothetical protein